MADELTPAETPEDAALETAFTDAAPEATPVVETPATPSPLFERAKELGLPLDDIDSNDKLAEFLLDQYKETQPYAQAGKHFLAQQPPAAEVDEEAEADEFDPDKYFSEKWPVPKWDQNFTLAIQQGLVTQDSDGRWVAAPGADLLVAPILGPLNQAHFAKQQAVQSLFQGNPYESIYKTLQEPLTRQVQQLIDKALGQHQQTTRQTGYVEQFEKEHASWLFKPGDGPRAFSEKGQALFAATNKLMQSGITDPQQALDFAVSMIGGIPKAAPAATPAAPIAPAAPVTPEDKSEQKKKGFLDKAVERAKHTPQSRGHETSDEPQVSDQNELNSMFVRAGRSKAGV